MLLFFFTFIFWFQIRIPIDFLFNSHVLFIRLLLFFFIFIPVFLGKKIKQKCLNLCQSHHFCYKQMGEDLVRFHLRQSLYLQSSHHLSLPPLRSLQRENNLSVWETGFKILCKQSPVPHAAKSSSCAVSIPKLILPGDELTNIG